MNNENDILAELKDLNSPLAGISRAMPYRVPAGYFEQLPENTISAIKSIEAPEVKPVWGANPYAAPAGYFDSLTCNLVSAAKAEHISVNTKEMPYHVPKGYFERLPGQVIKAVKALGSKKTIPLTAHMFRRVQWAAAAIFIIFMGIGGYIAFFNDHSYQEKILASIPGNEIHDYLQRTYRIDVDRIEANNNVNELQVDNREIVQYLDETGWDVVE